MSKARLGTKMKQNTMRLIKVGKDRVVIGILNTIGLIATSIILYFIFGPIFISENIFSFFEGKSFFEYVLFLFLPLFFLFSNIFALYKIYKSPSKIAPKITLLYLFFAYFPFWVLLYFFGYFSASSILFPIIALFITGIIFFFLRIISFFPAVVTGLISLALIYFAVVTGFEEDYCLAKAAQVSHPDELIAATKDDEGLREVKKGDKISRSFQAHIRCHKEFNFTNALKEKYLLMK